MKCCICNKSLVEDYPVHCQPCRLRERDKYKKALEQISNDDCKHESYEDSSDVCFRLQQIAKKALELTAEGKVWA